MTSQNMAIQRQRAVKPPLVTIPRSTSQPPELLRQTPTIVVDSSEMSSSESQSTDIDNQQEPQRQSWFQNKANELFNIPNGYEKVAVLFVRWDKSIDEFEGHDEEIERLWNLFLNRFHFECSIVKLSNSRKPQNQLNLAIAQHIQEHDGDNNLLIVYYTGHGNKIDSELHGTRLELSATQDLVEKRGAFVPKAFWDEAEHILRHSADGDVLSILDCCFASSAAFKSRNQELRNYSLIAASAADSPTLGPGKDSFTAALIDSLTELLDEAKGEGGTFPLAQLVERLNMKRRTPTLSWDRLRSFKRAMQLGPLSAERHRRPKNTANAEDPEKASLMLRFSLKEDSVNRRQVETFTEYLVQSCKDSKFPIRCIDWIKMEQTIESAMERNMERTIETTIPGGQSIISFPVAVRVLHTAQGWKIRSHARKHTSSELKVHGRKRESTEETPSPAKRRRSPRLKSNPSSPLSPRSTASMDNLSSS